MWPPTAPASTPCLGKVLGLHLSRIKSTLNLAPYRFRTTSMNIPVIPNPRHHKDRLLIVRVFVFVILLLGHRQGLYEAPGQLHSHQARLPHMGRAGAEGSSLLVGHYTVTEARVL